MFVWIATKLGISTMLVQVIFYSVVGLGILYGVRMYGNAQWAKGEAKGRETAIKYIEKDKIKQWEAWQKEYQTKLKQVDQLIAQTNNARLASDKARNDALAMIKSEREHDHTVVVTLPANELVPAIRAISSELAATE